MDGVCCSICGKDVTEKEYGDGYSKCCKASIVGEEFYTGQDPDNTEDIPDGEVEITLE